MDKANISIAAICVAGVASIFMIGNRANTRQSFSSETWEPGNPLPPSVKSLVKGYIESGQNPKGVGSLMGKIIGMISIENQNKGKLVPALMQEARNYQPQSLIKKRKEPNFKGTPFHRLPELPRGKSEYKLRMAPNPNAPLTLAHGLGVLINELYVQKYKEEGWDAKSILRIDDTDPDKINKDGVHTPPVADFYRNKSSLIQDNYKWICGNEPDIEYVASDHYQDYYEGIRKLMNYSWGRGGIGEGMAYLVEGKPGTTINDNIERCWSKTRASNLSQFEWLVENQTAFYVERGVDNEGNPTEKYIANDNCPSPEIRLRLSNTIINEMNLYFRGHGGLLKKERVIEEVDSFIKIEEIDDNIYKPTIASKAKQRADKLNNKKLMRLCKTPHQRHPNIYLWPTLAYQGPFDDWALGVSHIIRGADLIENEDNYDFFYNYVFNQTDDNLVKGAKSGWAGWKNDNAQLPEFLYWPRFNFIDMGDYLSYTDKKGQIQKVNTMSSSTLATIVEKNGISWYDENLPTINGLRSKGYNPEEIKRWWFSKFEKKYATSFSNAELLEMPLQLVQTDNKGNPVNWFWKQGKIKINGLNVRYIPPLKEIRNPPLNKMNSSELKGYLNNLITNSPDELYKWDEASFKKFMNNISIGISNLRNGGPQL
jgi:hypothetical protein